jgi:hypothetical protein
MPKADYMWRELCRYAFDKFARRSTFQVPCDLAKSYPIFQKVGGSMRNRQTPPRFKAGATVKIVSTMHSRFNGMTGVVIKVKYSRHSQTLDKYVVHFGPIDVYTFWDIEIEK